MGIEEIPKKDNSNDLEAGFQILDDFARFDQKNDVFRRAWCTFARRGYTNLEIFFGRINKKRFLFFQKYGQNLLKLVQKSHFSRKNKCKMEARS